MSSYSLVQLAQKVNGKVIGDSQVIITGIASMASATQGDITFFTNKKYCAQLNSCGASAIILSKFMLPHCPQNKTVLIVEDPYLVYAKIAQLFDNTPKQKSIIASTAIIAADVNLGDQVSIGDYAVIEPGVILGHNVIIGPHCYIGRGVKVDDYTRLWANVTLYHGIYVGKYCLIHSGSVIGADGFGFANDKGQWVKIPQLGAVHIGDRVEIGACTTIDRGTLDDTIIEDGTIIDNHCYIAHNVKIGKHTAVAGGVVMGGGLNIGAYCKIGGACAFNGHIKICDHTSITGMSMVVKSILQPGIYSSGLPTQSNITWRKMVAHVLNIDSIKKRLKILENTVNKKDNT